MFCQNCGNQIADTDCFCPLCGSKIHNYSQNNFTQQQFSQNDTIRNAEIDKIKSLIISYLTEEHGITNSLRAQITLRLTSLGA